MITTITELTAIHLGMKAIILIVLLHNISYSQLTESEMESSTVLFVNRTDYLRHDFLTDFYIQDSSIYKALGSGFFIYDDLIGTESYYLVTARHVFDNNIHEGPLTGMLMRMKEYDNMFDTTTVSERVISLVDSTKIKLWKIEEEDTSDVAIIKWNENREFEYKNAPYKPIKLSYYLPYDSIKINDSVFTVGYPADSLNRQLNVWRNWINKYSEVTSNGYIKDLWNEPYSQNIPDPGFSTYNLIISSLYSIGGQSGSPVFVKRNEKIYLAGIVTHRLEYTKTSRYCIANSIDAVIKIIKSNKDFFIKQSGEEK